MQSKLISKLFVLMYPLLVLYFLYTIKLSKPIELQNIHANRVLVEYQACSCPDFRVVEGHKALAEHLQNPSIHTKELDVINFPAIDYDYTKQLIIEGTVVATKKDTAGKVYPVFEITDWIPVDKKIPFCTLHFFMVTLRRDRNYLDCSRYQFIKSQFYTTSQIVLVKAVINLILCGYLDVWFTPTILYLYSLQL